MNSEDANSGVIWGIIAAVVVFIFVFFFFLPAFCKGVPPPGLGWGPDYCAFFRK
jgi:hypothetical protein